MDVRSLYCITLNHRLIDLKVHGAVLRVESPHDCKTFMVDPGFPKRVDAKTAVCLLAMSQGVGKHIRQLGEDVGNKITPEMRQDAQSIIPLIAAEYIKIWPEKCPDPYSYSREQDGKFLRVFVSI